MKSTVLFLLFLTGCGASSGTAFDAPEKPTVSVDFAGNWTPAEKNAVLAGFAEWPRGASYSLAIYRVSADAPQPDMCEADPDLLGHTYQGSRICLYVDAIGPSLARLQTVAAHEFGHALLLSFDGNYHYMGTGRSLMHVCDCSQGATDSPQAVDLAALAEVPE